MSNQKHSLSVQSIILIILFALLTAASTQMGWAESVRQKTPDRWTTTMARFQQDVQPSKQLARQAVTPCVNGMAGSYPCSNVDLAAFVPFSDMSGGGSQANDIWGWTDSASGREFAIFGRTNGTEFIEVTDPENPVHLGNLPTHTTPSNWRDVKTHGNYAIIGSEASGHGMQIFDLTQLLSVTSPITFSASAHFAGFGNSHNVVSNEDSDFVYGVGANTCSGGLHIVDLSDPLNPADAGCFSSDGYTHDAQCVIYNGPDSDHTGKEICLNSNEDTLTIVDVTNKSAPIQLSRSTYPGSAYTHQGWLTDDMAYFLLDDELDEQSIGGGTKTFIWDVRNLDNPQLINTYVAANPAIDHNLYVKDGIVYQANYRAGLRILDASDVANGNLTEIGYFDVYPANDNASFNGAWSVYPYFDSGTVIVSSIETGLFVLQPDFVPKFTFKADNTTIQQCIGQQSSTILSLTAQNGFSNPVSLTVDGVPTGVTANLDSTTAIPSDPAVQLMLDIANNSGAPGFYPIVVLASGGGIDLTTIVELELVGSTAVAPALESPSNNGIGTTIPQFRWAAIDGATSYVVEVATDANFTNIIATGTTTTPSYTAGVSLDTTTQYYWRVTVENLCGASATSDPFTFTTTNQSQICADPNLTILDGDVTSHTQTVDPDTLSGEIVDMDVSVAISHPYIGDLRAQLVHVDSGITIPLLSQIGAAVTSDEFGCGGSSFDAVFDDSNPDGVAQVCEQEVVGSFQPTQPLSAFVGQDISGSWQLLIADVASPDSGVLESWCLLPTLGTQGGGEPIVTEVPTTEPPTTEPPTTEPPTTEPPATEPPATEPPTTTPTPVDPTPTPSSPLSVETRHVAGQSNISPVLLAGLMGSLGMLVVFIGRKHNPM